MPRNGDGSGDSGPYEGHEILHGTGGDTTVQHTKHVAPMPQLEEGEGLPGMNASGGAAAPLNDASEEYGATAPRNKQFGDNKTSASQTRTSGSSNSRSATSSSNGAKSTTSGQQTSTKSSSSSQEINSKSTSGQTYGHSTHGFHKEHGKHDLEEVSREKAGRYVNLNEEDVQHASTGNKSKDGAERSSQRAPRDVGPKEDIEQLHGKASVGKGDDKSDDRDGDKSGKQGDHQGSNAKSGKQGSDSNGGGKGGVEGGKYEDPMRHNAAKFVNIEK